MFLRKVEGPRVVRLADGDMMTMADLPRANTRWLASRKADVVRAVEAGLLTPAQALSRYGLTEEEFAQWRRNYAAGGVRRLRVCAIRSNRHTGA